jgi:hypothetical protein
MAEMSLQALQKSALVVVPVAQNRKGPDIRCCGVNPELEELQRKQKTYRLGKAVLRG